MAVCFATRKLTLDADLVLDSQFYNPKKLEYLDKLAEQSKQKISDEFSEIIELTTSQEKLSFPSFVYDLTDSLGNLFADGEIANLVDDIGSAKKIAQSKDFAVSRLRYYLKEFGVVPKRKFPPLLSTEYVVLRQKSKVPPHLLIPYLLLSEIQFIFEHSQRGSNHPRLANKDILNLPLPDSLIKRAGEISDIVASAVEDFEQSKKLYPEAEQELLERMEWDKIKTEHILNYTATSEDILGDERLDPEFYQPKFENLEKHLKKIGAVELGKFCPMPTRGSLINYDESGDTVVINSKDLGANGIIDIEGTHKTNKTELNCEGNKESILNHFDLIFYAIGAYAGRTNCYLEKEKALAGNNVLVIKPDIKTCNPVYLALFLNSKVGMMLSQRYAAGSAQKFFHPQSLVKYPIFIPRDKSGKSDLVWQKKLADKIIRSSEAKKSAKQKLQEAKNLVEQEIDKLIN